MQLLNPGDLLQLRDIADTMMNETCVVFDPSTEVRVFNKETLEYEVVTAAKTVYEGVCGFTNPAPAVPATLGDWDRTSHDTWITQGSTFKTPPVDAGIRIGHMVRVLTSRADPDLVERRYRIIGLDHHTDPVVRRFKVLEVSD